MEIPEDIERVVRALCFEDEAFDDVCKAIQAERERCSVICDNIIAECHNRNAEFDNYSAAMVHVVRKFIMKGDTK